MTGALNAVPLTHIAATVCKCLAIDPPARSEGCIDDLCARLDALKEGAFDRVLLYNPDAIGQWVAEKYAVKFAPMRNHCQIVQPMRSVVPPKTPVCFGSIYSGASPSVHGITHYEKRRLEIDTLFDALIRAGKKPCIVSVADQSMDVLFRGRDMAYFACKNDRAAVDCALKLIAEDNYDAICVYNQAYDDRMHRSHPQSAWALKALDEYAVAFDRLANAVRRHWTAHNTLIGCLTDHGVHREWYLLGQHGKNIPQDMNILHWWGVIPRKQPRGGDLCAARTPNAD